MGAKKVPVYFAAPTPVDSIVVDEALPFKVNVAPNPTTTQFKLFVESKSTEVIQIRIYNVLGGMVEKLTDLKRNTTITIGDKYMGGTFFAEVMQGKNRKVVRLIKLN